MKFFVASNRQTIFLILGLFALGTIVQINVFFNQDVSWLMHAGKRLLQGGNYYTNFFEIDPPMAIFIHLPAVLLANTLNINFILSAFLYTAATGIVSLLLCTTLLNKIFTEEPTTKNYLLMTLAFVYFVLPSSQFGEREHLMLLLVMPYVMLAVLRLQEKTCNFWLAGFIGLLAGAGFIIKPFFLLTWFFIEIYFAFQKHKILSWIRPETIATILIGLGYLAAIALFTPDYVSKMLPFILSYYYVIVASSIVLVITNLYFCYGVLTSLFYLALRPYCHNRYFMDCLVLTTFSFLLIYLMQRTTWYYHILPAVGATTLLLITIFREFFTAPAGKFPFSLKAKRYITATFLVLLLTPLGAAANDSIRSIVVKQTSVRNQYISFVKSKIPNGTVYFISDVMTPTYPLVDYTTVTSVSRFHCLWPLLGLECLLRHTTNMEQREKLLATQKLITKWVTEDLQRGKPDLVFVQISSPNWEIMNFEIHYLDLFSQNPNFKSEWKNYTYLKTLGKYDIYQRSIR